jgi:hypothetical protein
MALRLLSKKGYALSTGFLLSSDLDAYVAKALGANLFTWPPKEGLTEEDLFNSALNDLNDCTLLVDGSLAGEKTPDWAPNSKLNTLNQNLINEAKNKGLLVLPLSAPEDLSPLFSALEDFKSKPKAA